MTICAAGLLPLLVDPDGTLMVLLQEEDMPIARYSKQFIKPALAPFGGIEHFARNSRAV